MEQGRDIEACLQVTASVTPTMVAGVAQMLEKLKSMWLLKRMEL
jgi:hypothetical protein